MYVLTESNFTSKYAVILILIIDIIGIKSF